MNPLEISSSEFRGLSERVTTLVAQYLDDLDQQAIAPAVTGQESLRLFDVPFPEQGIGRAVLRDLTEIMHCSRAQNGRFFGYVLGSGEPVAAVADLVASVLNQNVTAWRSSPAAVTIEKTAVRWLAEAIGCPGFHGHLTGGGSSANLMGMAMAREAGAPANQSGNGGKGIVYAADQIHMSIPKSIALLGIGRNHLHLIPTDRSLRMIPHELDRRIVQDKAARKTPIAVVASAGTVNTGAIDPLRQIAEIAHRHGAWFHVDGAYGALAAIADPAKFDGMALADSISLDPHKWLYQPLDCGCLLYRSPEAAQKAFSYTGEYARSLSNDPIEGFAFFEESVELSRRFRALKLWFSLRYHGLAAFRESIRKDLAQARRLRNAVRNESRLELLAPVELSAVCFRYKVEDSDEELNRFNAALLKRILKRGRIYLSNASLQSKFSLRACIVNHRTKDSDIDSVVPEVLEAAGELESTLSHP
jgi:aromatic-L-amino-acid/L-tryptophan decarboxylase